MKSFTINAHIDVQAPATAAWEVIAVYANDPKWRTGVSKMEQTPPGPVANDARTVEVMKLLGQKMENIAVISDVVAGSSFNWRVAQGADANGSRRVVALSQTHCRIEIIKNVRLTGLNALIKPLIQRTIQRNEVADLARVKALIEGRARTGAARQ